MMQTLEGRRLLSAAGSVDFKHGTIFVQGTSGADHVQFQSDPQLIHVNLNGVVSAFDAPRVTAIQINTADGDDTIVLGRKLKIGATIFAGSGNDTVSGGAGDDTIFGGNGNDFLDGRAGDDYLDGNDGDDRLSDYLGTNVFHGGAGNDSALEDPGLLGSGVESRQEAVVRDGIVTPDDIYDIAANSNGSGTYLFQENGRFILELMGATGSGSNQVSYEGLTKGSDGRYEVGTIVKSGGTGTADMKYFTHEWDVTDAIKNGLAFTDTSVRLGATPTDPDMSSTVSSTFLLPSSVSGGNS